MNKFQKYKSLINSDLYRYGGGKWRLLLEPGEIKYLRALRRLQTKAYWFGKIGRKYYMLKIECLKRKYHIQISPEVKIGSGFYIGHTGRIIIHPKAVIGNNCNIATGVTIGRDNRGKRKGYPTIGDRVWIGTNSVIVGNIHIGDDVLIAPLTFVNFDVPSHSVVIGNPATVHPKENATEGYINNIV